MKPEDAVQKLLDKIHQEYALVLDPNTNWSRKLFAMDRVDKLNKAVRAHIARMK